MLMISLYTTLNKRKPHDILQDFNCDNLSDKDNFTNPDITTSAPLLKNGTDDQKDIQVSMHAFCLLTVQPLKITPTVIVNITVLVSTYNLSLILLAGGGFINKSRCIYCYLVWYTPLSLVIGEISIIGHR